MALLTERTASRWRGLYFVPSQNKHAGSVCGGVEWYPPRDAGWKQTFEPILLGIQIIAAIHELWPTEFEWRVSPASRSHFDLLIGRKDVRIRIDRGDPPGDIARDWPAAAGRFHAGAQKLYT